MSVAQGTWWSRDQAGAPHLRLLPLVQSMRRQQAQRYLNMRRLQSVYEYGNSSASTSQNDLNSVDDRRLHFNVAKNAIDAMHALIMATKVNVMLLTDGGNWSQQQRAKDATRAIDGLFNEEGFEEIQEDCTLDGLISYHGYVRVSPIVDVDDMTADIKIDRVLPEDVMVDEAEGRYRKPRCMYTRRMVDRYVVLAEFGGPDADLYGSANARAAAIMKATNAPAGIDTETDRDRQNIDQIEVWEAWHLPSGKKSKDGRHVICIDGCTLFDEEWTRRRFPIAVYRPEKSRVNYWGLSTMRDAMAGQREYSRVTEKLQRAHKKMGGSHWLVGASAELNPREITNGEGTLIRTADINQVKQFTPEPAAQQTYSYRAGIADDILRYLGLSTQSSRMEVPAGLQNASGKALQAFEDSESKRLVMKHRARERFVVDVASLVLEEAACLIKDGYKISTRSVDKHGFNEIDWNDIVDVIGDEKNYVVKIFPIGMLSEDPPAKFAQLDALMQRGAITTEQFKRLLGLPDLEAEADIDVADTEIVDMNLDIIVTKGERIIVEPAFDALDVIISRGAKFYNHARKQGVPEARLSLIRQYIQDAQQAMATLQPPAPPPGAGGAPPPGGPPLMPAGPMDPQAQGAGPMPPGGGMQ